FGDETNRQCYRTASNSVNGTTGYVTVAVLRRETIRRERSASPCAFGLSPKFSTPVEKTVEQRRETSGHARVKPVSGGSRGGRTRRIATGWAFRTIAHSDLRQNPRPRGAKPRRSPLC